MVAEKYPNFRGCATYLCESAFSHMKIIKSKYISTMTDNHLVACLRLATSSCYTSDSEKLTSFSQCHGLPLTLEAISISQTQRFTFFVSVLFSVWFISRWLVIKQIYVYMYVFKKGNVYDVTCEVWVVLQQQKSVVKLATAGWKRCEWVCDVDTRLVDLGRGLLEK